MAASLIRRRLVPLVTGQPAVLSIACRCIASRQTEFMRWKKKEFYQGKMPENQRDWHRRGPLPRLVNEDKTKGEMHRLIFPLKDVWHPTDALKGQNDFVDILGDGSVHPVRLITNSPRWLRGFNGHEIQMLNRMRRAFPEWEETRPQKWLQLKKRITKLYKQLNLDRRPPPFQEY